MADNPPFNIDDYAYEGLWKNYNATPLWVWTWTLSDSKALLLVACLTFAVAFVQTRTWTLLRFIVYRLLKKGSPRLNNAQHPDFRENLSQAAAISHFLPYFQKVIKTKIFKEQDPTPDEISDMSPLFGLMAIMNIASFFALRVIIPWILTDGSLETPIVNSKVTDTCLGAKRYEKLPALFDALPQTEILFQSCRFLWGTKDFEKCIGSSLFVTPLVQIERLQHCPFPGNICQPHTLAVELTHSNISAYELGINTPRRLTMDHRLTCAPLILDSFYVFENSISTSEWPVNISISVLDASAPGLNGTALYQGYATQILTMNGPNSLSQVNSGQLLSGNCTRSISPSLKILPEVLESWPPNVQHPGIRTNSSVPFLIIYEGGTSPASVPVDDALFAAHNICPASSYQKYRPDYEAIALVCSETFRFCKVGVGCTDWGMRSAGAYQMAKEPLVTEDGDTLGDILTLYRMMPSLVSVMWYLGLRTMLFRSNNPYFILDAYTRMDYSGEELWEQQVEIWFWKGIIDAIHSAQLGARYPLDEDSENFDIDFKHKHSLCGRVLFRHGSYTNISWIGMWVTIGVLAFISLMTYIVDDSHRIMSRPAREIVKPVVRGLSLEHFKEWSIWKSRSPRRPQGVSSRPSPSGIENELDDIATERCSADIADEPVIEDFEDIDGLL